MKRFPAIVLPCLCTLALAVPATAQEGFRLGIKGGYTAPSTDITTRLLILEGQKSSGGIVVGVAAEGNLYEALSFEAEALYTERKATNVYFGGTGPGGTPLGNVTAEYKFKYLEVPAHFKYTFTSGSVRPYALAGVVVGFPLSIESTNTANGRTGTENARHQFSSAAWWLDVGAGLDFRVNASSGTSVLVEGRYNYTLGSFASESFDSWKWKDWRILAGVKFRM